MTKTVLEFVNKLYKYFYTNDIFNLDSDFSKVLENSNNIELDKAILVEALKTLEEKKIVKKIEYVSNKKSNSVSQSCWVLLYPLQLQDQNIELSAHACLNISNTINTIGQLIDNKDFTCDSTNITEKDIIKLLEITNQFIESARKAGREEDNDTDDSENS